MDAQWIPGDFIGAVCPGGALLAEDVVPRSVAAAWQALRAGQDLETVSQQLVVSPRPSSQLRYAVTTWAGGQLRVLVSAGFAVRVCLEDREELISPTEQDSPVLTFSGVSRWELSDAWYAEVGSDQEPLPVRDGVVFAEALRLTPARWEENEPNAASATSAPAGQEWGVQAAPVAAQPQSPGPLAAPTPVQYPPQAPLGQPYAAPAPHPWAQGGVPGPLAPAVVGTPPAEACLAAQPAPPDHPGEPGQPYTVPAELASQPHSGSPYPSPEPGYAPFPGGQLPAPAAAVDTPPPAPAPAAPAWGQPTNAESSPFAPSGAPTPPSSQQAPSGATFISGVPSQLPATPAQAQERWAAADYPALARFAPPA